VRFLFKYDQATTRGVQVLIDTVEDMAKPPTVPQRMRVGDAVRKQMQRAFTGQGTIQGSPWARLARRTVQERVRLGFPGERPILIRSGYLKRSWTEYGAPNHIEKFATTGTGWTLNVGTSDFRAKWHEHGTPRMPARPVLEGMHRQAIGIIDAIQKIYDERWNRAKGG
jgi:hypothetical protein